jgi:CheY-like chemotaxis protein
MTDTQVQSSEIQTVLVVEDEVLIRMVISEYLRECGYRVIEAAHAEEAVAILQEPEVDIDIVFSDVEMAADGMDGFGLMRWVRLNRPELKVVMAGSPARAADMAGDLCESGPLLSKPYDPQFALDRIRRLLAERKAPKNPLRGAHPGAMFYRREWLGFPKT